MLVGRTQPAPERRPRCEVMVGAGTAGENEEAFRQAGVVVTESGDTGPALGLRSIVQYVEGIRTTKSLDSPAGTFELRTTFRTVEELAKSPLHRILAPNNVVQIRLDAGIRGSVMRPIMTGWITQVGADTTVAQNGRVVRQVHVRGHDAGKFLLRHSLPGHLLSGFLLGEGELSERLRNQLIISGTVGDVLHGIFEGAFASLVPSPRAVWDQIQLATDPALDGEDDGLLSNLVQDNVWLRHGKFWSLFKSFTDPAWNEAYGDYILPRFVPATGAGLTADPPTSIYARYRRSKNAGAAALAALGGGYTLIVRPFPFDRARWEALPTHEVFDSELRYESARRSDDERVNLVYVSPQGHIRASTDEFFDAMAFQTVQFSRDEAERHGTHAFQASSIYTDLGVGAHTDADELTKAASGQGSIAAALRERAARLWRWHAVNHQLWKAVWIVAGDPELKIGERVRNQQEPSGFFDANEYERRTYYIERVVQDYSETDGHYFTHLALTRGQKTGTFVTAPAPDLPAVGGGGSR